MRLLDSTHARGRERGIFIAAVLAAVAVAGPLAAAVQAQPPAPAPSAPAPSRDPASTLGQVMASRKPGRDVGIRGHGFVRDGDVFTTIDAPGAGFYTVVSGIDDRGRTVGGYVDDRGTLHGFLKDKQAFTVIDFPGAKATFVSRINAQGQIVGAYSEEPNTAVLSLPHGFLSHDGVFTPVDVPGAVLTQPFGINNRGQIVGFSADGVGRRHGFLLNNGVFTTPKAAPGAFQDSFALDIDDGRRIVGAYF